MEYEVVLVRKDSPPLLTAGTDSFSKTDKERRGTGLKRSNTINKPSACCHLLSGGQEGEFKAASAELTSILSRNPLQLHYVRLIPPSQKKRAVHEAPVR